jgi:hypothetical protein
MLAEQLLDALEERHGHCAAYAAAIECEQPLRPWSEQMPVARSFRGRRDCSFAHDRHALLTSGRQ